MLNQAADASAFKWSRAPASRRRADSLDVRSSSNQQRPRRGRRLAATEDKDKQTSSSLFNCSDTVFGNPIEESFSNSYNEFSATDNNDIHETISPLAYGSVTSGSSSDASSFTFPPTRSRPAENSYNSRTPDNLSPFGVSLQPPLECLGRLDIDCGSDFQALAGNMTTHFSPTPTWNGQPFLSSGSSPGGVCLLDDNSYVTFDGDKLSDLFSDIAMSYDDAAVSCLDSSSLYSGSLLSTREDDDDEELLLRSPLSQTKESDLRRGSNAPPPSPEYESSAVVNNDTNSELWSSVLSCKFNEQLSNSSDMDTDH